MPAAFTEATHLWCTHIKGQVMTDCSLCYLFSCKEQFGHLLGVNEQVTPLFSLSRPVQVDQVVVVVVVVRQGGGGVGGCEVRQSSSSILCNS